MKKYILAAIVAASAFGASAADIPAYPGGAKAMNEFIAANLRYPSEAIENGVEGVVRVIATIGTDGKVTAAKIARPIDPFLEAEAVRIVKKMPAWTPADKNGQPVESTVTVTIRFILP